MNETTFTWAQIIDKICRRLLAHLPNARADEHLEGGDLLKATVEASKKHGEDQPAFGQRFSDLPDIAEFLSLSYDWIETLGSADLQDFCNGDGLLGKIGRLPSCNMTSGLGRGKGTVVRYLESTVDRLMYVSFARVVGLGPSKIKGALTHDIHWMSLPFCGDERNYKYMVTKPLLEVLNSKNVDWDTMLDIYYELSGIQNHKVGALTVAMERKLLDYIAGVVRSGKPGKRRKGSLPQYAEMGRSPGRDILVFHNYISDGIRANRYLADFKKDIGRAEKVVAAIKRIADAEVGEGDPADKNLLQSYNLPDYSLVIQQIPCEKRGEKKSRSPTHFIYKFHFAPKTDNISLLQQASSHLLWIMKHHHGQKGEWIKRCQQKWRTGPCPRYFFPFLLNQSACDVCGRRKRAKRRNISVLPSDPAR